MKPFDLQKAIEGHPLVTRDGREVTEFYYFKTAHNDKANKCVAVINGFKELYNEAGMQYQNEDNGDLFLKSKKKKLFVAIYKEAEKSSEKWHINAAYSCTDLDMLKGRYDLSTNKWQIVEVEIDL